MGTMPLTNQEESYLMHIVIAHRHARLAKNNEPRKKLRMNQKLISERELADHLGLKKSLIRKLRVEKKIPHFDLGYRTVMYNLPDVLTAM